MESRLRLNLATTHYQKTNSAFIHTLSNPQTISSSTLIIPSSPLLVACLSSHTAPWPIQMHSL